MDALVEVAIGFSSLNIALLLGLLYMYGRMVFRTHAGYTLGLMIFSGLLLVQNSLMVYICGFLTDLYAWQLYPFLDGLAIFEFAGLVALLRVTL
ncbi:MAG TPA: hypothetical protein VEC02_00330 [Nitrososphaerales archaeon]|nr:hypothetical protein [Nitrososphaerales archaeon]